jgi:2-hydroxychromene-2-carboxylate isomerase
MKSAISRVITTALTSHTLRDASRGLRAAIRRAGGRMAEVHYFHQSDDPYSYLAAQVLARFAAAHDISLVPHIVPAPADNAAPERERLTAWSIRDAATLAARLGLDWPDAPVRPDADMTALADAALAKASAEAFAATAVSVGKALWHGDRAGLAAMAAGSSPEETAAALKQGAELRESRGHYLGATFSFEGEWYWGVDRLHYLEARLRGQGLARDETASAICPVKDIELTARPTSGAPPDLHFFYSFRSPYTYISVPRVRTLARHYGARLHLRFILPMVMRGLPVPRMKSMYIMRDTKREADRVGLPFGTIVDPVGAATERAIAVLHRAIPLGLGEEFSESFLRGVWSEGIDCASDAGLFKVAARAGLDEAFVRAALADDSWRAPAEVNRKELLSMGLWGAPTLRVNDRPAHWGQDRLWAIEQDLIDATGAK